MGKRFCTQCGTHFSPDDAFCANCGAPTGGSGVQAAEPVAEVSLPLPASSEQAVVPGGGVQDGGQATQPSHPHGETAPPSASVPLPAEDVRSGDVRRSLWPTFLLLGMAATLVIVIVVATSARKNQAGTQGQAPAPSSYGVSAGSSPSYPANTQTAPSAPVPPAPQAAQVPAPREVVPTENQGKPYCNPQAENLQCASGFIPPSERHELAGAELDTYTAEVTELYQAGKYTEAICMAQNHLGWAQFSPLQKGRVYYEMARSFKALYCTPKACDALHQSLLVRPKEGKGFEVACQACRDWDCFYCAGCN